MATLRPTTQRPPDPPDNRQQNPHGVHGVISSPERQQTHDREDQDPDADRRHDDPEQRAVLEDPPAGHAFSAATSCSSCHIRSLVTLHQRSRVSFDGSASGPSPTASSSSFAPRANPDAANWVS